MYEKLVFFVNRIILFTLPILLFSFYDIRAESDTILITQSNKMEEIIFDGKWTYPSEWKQSSWEKLVYDDGMVIHLRIAHQNDFIYVFVDPANDHSLDKGMDKATVCFDGKNNKSFIPDKDDFCFSVSLGNKEGTVFQGGSPIAFHGNLQKISNPIGFVAISSTSDENDRYTATPHPSYEFKIPIDTIKRSNNYGFYFSLYDGNAKLFYSWPIESPRESVFRVISPESWGNIVSPDNSLPEFDFPLFILFPALLITIFVTKFINNVYFRKIIINN